MTKKLNTEGTIQAVSTLCNGGVEILIDADTQFVTVELDDLGTIDLIEQLANRLTFALAAQKSCSTKRKTAWHPFPEELPPKSGYYLITNKDGEIHTDRWSEDSHFESSDGWDIEMAETVLAWAQLPKPYVKPNESMPTGATADAVIIHFERGEI